MQWTPWVLVVLLAGCLSGGEGTTDPATILEDPVWLPLGELLASPLAPGPMTWTQEDYDLGATRVGGADASHSDYAYESLIRGVITVPSGEGPFPLAVFLHGQHTTCAGPNGEEGGDCSQPYRNDQGYLYLMEHLASHGIATASILAHEINNENGLPDTGMWARGELVLATLDALANSTYTPRLDFSRIGLMGHSRGGEGVVTAVEVNNGRPTPYTLSAVVALAPTDFAFRSVPDVPFLTLAPYCDGDVYSLHGLRQFDQSRYVDDGTVKVQLLVMGANHNNYNTQWGRGWTNAVVSDGDDAMFGRHQNTHCDLRREDGGGRLSLEETYAQAILHMGGFLRWNLLDEGGFAPYFLGAPQPAEACPAATSCPGAVHVSTMTPGRRDMFWAESTGLVGAPGVQVPDATVCQMTACAENVYSSAWMADMTILQEASLRFTFDAPADLRETPTFLVRIGVPTDKSVPELGPPTMAVTFEAGPQSITIAIDHPALFMPPALPADPGVGALGFIYLGGAKVAANAVEVPLPAELDAGNVTAIVLTFGPATYVDRILVADGWFNRATSSTRSPP